MVLSTVLYRGNDIFEITDDDGGVYGIRASSPEAMERLLKAADGKTAINIEIDDEGNLCFEWKGRETTT